MNLIEKLESMNLPIYHDFETLDMKLRLVTYRRQDIYDPKNERVLNQNVCQLFLSQINHIFNLPYS